VRARSPRPDGEVRALSGVLAERYPVDGCWLSVWQSAVNRRLESEVEGTATAQWTPQPLHCIMSAHALRAHLAHRILLPAE
jgi:hypothetical protein